MKQVHIFGGGTISHIRCHLALAAPAYGSTARVIYDLFCGRNTPPSRRASVLEPHLHLTAMCHADSMQTNADVQACLQDVVDNPETKIIFFNVALCDFDGTVLDNAGSWDYRSWTDTDSGKYAERLESAGPRPVIQLTPAPKLLPIVRQRPNSEGKVRKDITLVAFKTTCNASPEEMYLKGLKLLKDNSCNLVLVNDVVTRRNMIVTPEEAAYHETTNRHEAIFNLVDMAVRRSQLTFTQSTVIASDTVPWDSPQVPKALREVVNHLIEGSAYKPFQGATVGHFACKLDATTFLTSIRKSNFNDLAKIGMVLVKTDGPDTVCAMGAKPSVGGQSQRIVFADHAGYDCIVHAHVPLRTVGGLLSARGGDSWSIPFVSQRNVECGSHECGRNTSDNMARFDLVAPDGHRFTVKAVHLDNHGPNILFNSASVDVPTLIQWIDANWDLSQKTGGYQLPAAARA